MDENLRIKNYETASSKDLDPVMNCVGKCSARNCSNGLLVQVRPQALISRVSCVKDRVLDLLIDDPEVWFEYRRMRNITSHTYDEATAEKVAGSTKSFLKDAKSLLESLEKG